MNQQLTDEQINELLKENIALRQQLIDQQQADQLYYPPEEQTSIQTHATRFVLGAVGTLAL